MELKINASVIITFIVVVGFILCIHSAILVADNHPELSKQIISSATDFFKAMKL